MTDYEIRAQIQLWLNEDVGNGDHTSLSTIPAVAEGTAQLIAKENGILSGINMAKLIFKQVDSSLGVEINSNDGEKISYGDILLTVSGKARSILVAERLVLNVMQRMSGIATATASYVNLISHTKAKLLDTRKTTPGFRFFEKEAVKTGGGENHRFGLYDMILIKDNHIDFAGGIIQAIHNCEKYIDKNGLDLKLEVEVRSLEDIQKVLNYASVDRILLDNFTIENTRKAVAMINEKCKTESSGGITPESIRGYAECGVDYISVGALTHHIKSLDMSLKANF